MKSFKIGRIMGINIYIHFLFIVFVAFIALANLAQFGLIHALKTTVLLLAFFACVLLHELGHCLVAKHYKIPVRDIVLWPLGGIANIQGMPKNPDTEIKIVIAGPLVNFAIALILVPIALATYHLLKWDFFMILMAGNVLLMVFNLIPAFPMDGGRILRAFLAKKHNYLYATNLATKVGKIAAILMAICGIFVEPWLILIAAFVYIAGQEELTMIQQQYQYGNSFDSGNQNPQKQFFVFIHRDSNGNHKRFF